MGIRTVVWNIQRGGGKRKAAIAEALASFEADVIVLPEWAPSAEPSLVSMLRERGLRCLSPTVGPANGDMGVLVVSPHPLRRGGLTLMDNPTRMVHAIIEVASVEVDVLGVYTPSGGKHATDTRARKEAHLRELTSLSAGLVASGRPAILAGDLNSDHLDDTGALHRNVGEPLFAELVATGWTDAHRAVQPPGGATWWATNGERRGFRLDHVLTSGPLRAMASQIVTDHDGRRLVRTPDCADGTPGLSDHAALLVDMKVN